MPIGEASRSGTRSLSAGKGSPRVISPMLACVDVDYRAEGALAACLTFAEWTDGAPLAEFTELVPDVEPYQPGEFYLSRAALHPARAAGSRSCRRLC